MSLAKAIGWPVAFMLLGIGTSALLLSGWAAATYGDVARGLNALVEPGPLQTTVAGLCQLLGFGFATWVVGFRALGLHRADLRWSKPAVGVPGLAWGLVLGAAAAAVALLTAVVVAGSDR